MPQGLPKGLKSPLRHAGFSTLCCFPPLAVQMPTLPLFRTMKSLYDIKDDWKTHMSQSAIVVSLFQIDRLQSMKGTP